MAKYILKRLLRSLVTALVIITAVFSLLRLMPVEGYFNNYDKLRPSQINAGLERLGLNKPLHEQLTGFYRQLLRGDLGVSNKYRVGYPISKIIAQKMPLSLKIGFMALALALAAGLPLGVLMAKSAGSNRRIKLWDGIGSTFVVLVESIPPAVYYLFIQIYGTELLNNFINLPLLFKEDNPLTWILPVFSLSLGNMSLYAMWTRRYMIDESTRDYVQLARAKGVSPAAISRSHVFRNAVVPLVQYIPTSLMLTLMGSLYVESRYSIPGMGGLLVDVIKRQDNTMVQALVLIYALISISGLLIGDILMAAVDPRINLAGKADAR